MTKAEILKTLKQQTMKTKVIILLALSAIATLSFTFSSVNKSVKGSKDVTTENQAQNEPAGGFVSEDKF